MMYSLSMKKFLIMILGILLIGCSSPKQIAFERKTECAKYLPEAEKHMKEMTHYDEKNRINSVAELEKMFFSPKVNSCVYRWTSHAFFGSTGQSLEVVKLHDALTGEVLEVSDPIDTSDTENFLVAKRAFDSVVEKYELENE